MSRENIKIINYGDRGGGPTKWEMVPCLGHTQRNGNAKPMGGIFYVRYMYTCIHTYVLT